MAIRPLRSAAGSRGLTLIQVVVVALVLGAIAVGLLLLFRGQLGGGPSTPKTVARTEYSANWETPPPDVLTSAGATVTYKVEARTDTIRNGFVAYSGAWKDVKGASITFSLKGASARLSAGSTNNVLTVTVTTNDDGEASATLSPESNEANELRVHVRTPSGQEGDGTPRSFEINP